MTKNHFILCVILMLTLPLGECWHFFDYGEVKVFNWYLLNKDAQKDITWFIKDNSNAITILLLSLVWHIRERFIEKKIRKKIPNYTNHFVFFTLLFVIYYLGDWVMYLLINRRSGWVYSSLYFFIILFSLFYLKNRGLALRK